MTPRAAAPAGSDSHLDTANFLFGSRELNVWLFALAQQMRSPDLDPTLGLISALGSFPPAVYYARAIGGAALKVVRDPQRRTLTRTELNGAWADVRFRFLLAAAIAAVLVHVLKGWLDFPRPWKIYGPHFGDFTLLVDSEGSFPSGHATVTAVVVGSLWAHAASRSARALLLVYLALVGISRILLGAHFPEDVAGGYAVEFASVWTASRILSASRLARPN